MEVQYITYAGDRLPIRVGYRAFKKFNEDRGYEFGKSVERDDEGNITDAGDPVDQEVLLYYSLESGHHAVHKSLKNLPFGKEDMEFILDEVYLDFVRLIREFMQDVTKETSAAGNLQPNRAQRRKQKSLKSKAPQ